MNLVVISAAKSGDLIAEKLKKKIEFKYIDKEKLIEKTLDKTVEEAFKEYEGVIFISSTGIAVRGIAKHIKDKKKDPAVVVVDASGRYAISLLSGHLGGANELAIKLANIIGAEPIITTATDSLGILAPDMIAKENNLIISDMKKAKKIASMLIEGEKIAFVDEENLISLTRGYVDGSLYLKDNNLSENSIKAVVVVTNKESIKEPKNNLMVLKLIRKNIVLGIGCKKAFPKEVMVDNIKEVLKKENLEERAVALISTVSIKEKEEAILYAVKEFNCAFKTFTTGEIETVEDKYEGSDFVKETIGVRSVCEPVVELSGGEILKKKEKLKGMTLCVGKLY